jgi:hypothetical protein
MAYASSTSTIPSVSTEILILTYTVAQLTTTVTVDREQKSEVALIFCLQLQTEYTREVLPHGPPVD